eukprot:g1409.t1
MAGTTRRERRNWQIHLAFVRHEHKECLRMIEQQLRECNGVCEYALYVKALILRRQGRAQESLQLFQAAVCLNPHNVSNLKQVGRSLYLLGKHKAALEVFEETQRVAPGDWEVHHNQGLCHMYLKSYDTAIDCFKQANSLHRHDSTFVQLGKVYALKEDYKAAIEVLTEALEFSPENPELLTNVGLLYLRLGENYRAFDYLGNSLTHDPTNAKTILAAGSVIQDHQDMDVALVKYRVAAVSTPHSAQLWNNIGMCFFGKQRYVAAISCLKHALYIDPFEWIISYNLGLVHLNTDQHASAFHYFSACINQKPDFASSYMYLAITLSRLDDFENACSAYEKAIDMDADHLFHLNYTITLFNNDEVERAREQFGRFEQLFAQNETTKDMIFTLAECIEWLSDNMTLLPGTVVMTGTPSGVAAGRPPPNFLRVGDVVECDVSGIGTISNTVVAAPEAVAAAAAGGASASTGSNL